MISSRRPNARMKPSQKTLLLLCWAVADFGGFMGHTITWSTKQEWFGVFFIVFANISYTQLLLSEARVGTEGIQALAGGNLRPDTFALSQKISPFPLPLSRNPHSFTAKNCLPCSMSHNLPARTADWSQEPARLENQGRKSELRDLGHNK